MDFAKMLDALRQVPIQTQIYSQEARRIIGDIVADNTVAFVGEVYTETHSYLCAIRYGKDQPELWRLSYASDNAYHYMGIQSSDITYSVVSDLYEKIKPDVPGKTLYYDRIRKYSRELNILENDMDKLKELSKALEEKHMAKTLLLRRTMAVVKN